MMEMTSGERMPDCLNHSFHLGYCDDGPKVHSKIIPVKFIRIKTGYGSVEKQGIGTAQGVLEERGELVKGDRIRHGELR